MCFAELQYRAVTFSGEQMLPSLNMYCPSTIFLQNVALCCSDLQYVAVFCLRGNAAFFQHVFLQCYFFLKSVVVIFSVLHFLVGEELRPSFHMYLSVLQCFGRGNTPLFQNALCSEDS